jgi:proteasome lid subunit RPN8/RPN11
MEHDGLLVTNGAVEFFRDIQQRAETVEECGYLFGIVTDDHITIDGGFVLRNTHAQAEEHFMLSGKQVREHIAQASIPQDAFIGVFHTHPEAMVEEDAMPSTDDMLGVPFSMIDNPHYIYSPAVDLLCVFNVAQADARIFSGVAYGGIPQLEAAFELPSYV